MKKSYETPSAEKISFNYRDQVVAASGGGSSYSSEYGSCYDVGDVVDYLLNVVGICQYIT